MRIVLFGDLPGVLRLLSHIPTVNVASLVGASIRPQYQAALSSIGTELGIPLLVQPPHGDPTYSDFKNAVSNLQPDLIWVSSYSMIIREDILDLAQLGGINIHSALLPRYRGCNPTQWAILNNETEVGVTLHEINAGIDEGPIIDQRKVPLLFEDTWQTVHGRIAVATDELIAANLPTLLEGKWVATPQDGKRAIYGRRRTPDDSLFDWSKPVISIYNQVRALLPPLPPAYFLDTAGERVSLDRYHTPAEITALKYPGGGGDAL